MPTYELVNPRIMGTFKTTYDESSPKEAANAFWKNLTKKDKLVVNEVFSFPFSMRGGDGKLHHFLVTEIPENKQKLDYGIKDITEEVQKNTNSKEISNTMIESNTVQSQLSAKAMAGGKKKKDDDSSSSSSSDSDEDVDGYLGTIKKRFYNYPLPPIYYWWYSPYIYRYRIKKIFTPTFARPLYPYTQLYLL